LILNAYGTLLYKINIEQAKTFTVILVLFKMGLKEAYNMQSIKNKETFEEVISSSEPVVVKFHADWCPDCRRMDMFIDDIIEKYNQYRWYDINKDEFPEIAEKYDVMGIPSLLIYRSGEKVAHLHSANAKSPEQVTEFLDQVNL
jgi:thioredoxin-like negative regulator of GroEL